MIGVIKNRMATLRLPIVSEDVAGGSRLWRDVFPVKTSGLRSNSNHPITIKNKKTQTSRSIIINSSILNSCFECSIDGDSAVLSHRDSYKPPAVAGKGTHPNSALSSRLISAILCKINGYDCHNSAILL